MDAELEFAIQPSTLGKQLVDQVLHLSVHHHHCSKAAVYPSKLKELVKQCHEKKKKITSRF